MMIRASGLGKALNLNRARSKKKVVEEGQQREFLKYANSHWKKVEEPLGSKTNKWSYLENNKHLSEKQYNYANQIALH